MTKFLIAVALMPVGYVLGVILAMVLMSAGGYPTGDKRLRLGSTLQS